MMFQRLQMMMKTGDSLAISVVLQQDGRLRLTVHPVGDFKNKALSTSLSMDGTAEELDHGMVEEIERYVGTHVSLREQVDAAAIIMEAARKEVATASSKATQRPAPAKPKAAVAGKVAEAAAASGAGASDDADPDDTDDDAADEQGGTPAAPAAEVSGEQAAVDIFG